MHSCITLSECVSIKLDNGLANFVCNLTCIRLQAIHHSKAWMIVLYFVCVSLWWRQDHRISLDVFFVQHHRHCETDNEHMWMIDTRGILLLKKGEPLISGPIGTE